MISLACANVPPRAYLNILDCLLSRRIGRGKYVERFEEKIKEYFGVKHAIAVANGTLADTIMLATMKELYPERDEVILPAFTFVAQANAVLWAGLKPVFVDYEEEDIEKYITPKTLCYFPVHLLGVKGFGNRYDIPTIEDCCEAMGGYYKDAGLKFGMVGLAGAFSMYPSHTITTGEGGFIITNNNEFARLARSIHNHGKLGTDHDFGYVGINAKMTNIQASIGCELIQGIDEVNRKRRENVDLYNKLLGGNFSATAPHCYPVLYDNNITRDIALGILKKKGIESRKLMGCIPSYPHYIKLFGKQSFPKAERLADCGLYLPVHQQLKKQDIERICEVLDLVPRSQYGI